MKNILLFPIFIGSIFNINPIDSAKILGIFNMPSYSHFVLGETLFKELAKQGHEVTMMSAFPQKTPIKNYRDIYLEEASIAFKEHMKSGFDLLNFGKIPFIVKLFFISRMTFNVMEQSFENKDVQNLIKSDEKFDLIIIEAFLNEAFYGFAHKFKAPVISLGTSDSSIWVNRLTANPSPSSFVASPMLPYSPEMNLFQRLNNLISEITGELVFNLFSKPQQNALMHKYFPNAPHLDDLVYNTSFVLLNSHPAQSAPVPLTPNMKQIGGFHINHDNKLPDDIKKFLDDSKEGVVYFALGSNLKSASLPKEKLEAILNGFKKWKKPVLWKFEDESLPGKPDNVKISKWLPQPAVLAHPNVKVFISHGGKLSILEASYFGVPIIGIPIFAEQPYNVQQINYAGNGFIMEFESITEDVIYNNLVEITSNPKYKNEAKLRSEAMRSGKMTALEEAVYWIEYVIKFKGAAHLRNHGINLMWYEKYMLDVACFVGLVFLGFAWLLKCCCKKFCKKSCNKSKKNQPKTKTQ
nr:UDP-glucuronosyltransferase 2C1-like [Onthophagus taurus]